MTICRKFRVGLIITLLSPALLCFSSPSIAGTPTSSPALIDRDFEVALRKFVSKRFFNRIDANDEQREKLSKIMSDVQEESRAQREELRRGMLELSDLMADTKNSDESIKEKVNSLRKLHESIQDRRLSAMLEARKVLNDDQRRQINDKVHSVITGGIKAHHISMMMKSSYSSFMDE